MISIVITSFKEPTAVGKAIDAIIRSANTFNYVLIVAAPDKETQAVVKKYQKRNKRIRLFQDPGKGKSYALNLILKKLKGDIAIFTDGDVFVEKSAIRNLLKPFNDPQVGFVTGRPVSINSRKNMFGYWSHLLCDAGAHAIRLRNSKKGLFFEGTGYLFAIRIGIITKFPINVAEDSVIPYLIQKKGYKLKYAPAAKVYVKWPTNFKDWMKQKIRTAKAHENLNKFKDFPKVKSFWNEIKFGTIRALIYPTNLKEFSWTLCLFIARFLVWMAAFLDNFIFKKQYKDGWEAIKSTK